MLPVSRYHITATVRVTYLGRCKVENIEKVLDGVRPFLSVAGGSIAIHSLTGVSSIQVNCLP